MENGKTMYVKKLYGFLCFVDRASFYDLVNRTNLVHNFS